VDGFVTTKHDRTLHLPLAEAAARTFYQLTGRAAPNDPDSRDRALGSVAHALANLIPIYVRGDADVAPRQVTPWECLRSTFSDGATALTLPGGMQLRPLTVQARDLTDAVTVLRAVKARFIVQTALPGESERYPRPCSTNS
jgi:hypothetical protein